MSWVNIKDYKYSVTKDSEAIAFFVNEEDAEVFLNHKQTQPDADDFMYDIGYYVDIDVDVQIRGS